jgi:hypothetical protein
MRLLLRLKGLHVPQRAWRQAAARGGGRGASLAGSAGDIREAFCHGVRRRARAATPSPARSPVAPLRDIGPSVAAALHRIASRRVTEGHISYHITGMSAQFNNSRKQSAPPRGLKHDAGSSRRMHPQLLPCSAITPHVTSRHVAVSSRQTRGAARSERT